MESILVGRPLDAHAMRGWAQVEPSEQRECAGVHAFFAFLADLSPAQLACFSIK